ncbi:hypothetical protein TCAP_02760, partial [Tolypocladium capitatum]
GVLLGTAAAHLARRLGPVHLAGVRRRRHHPALPLPVRRDGRDGAPLEHLPVPRGSHGLWLGQELGVARQGRELAAVPARGRPNAGPGQSGGGRGSAVREYGGRHRGVCG